MKELQFRGIVAVGNTRAQAVNRYRMLALGKGATCFVDRNNNSAFVSNAGTDLENFFNPLSGNIDLEQSEEALENLQFSAQAGDVHEAFHFHCTAGCNSHTVYDSDVVKNCPVCSIAVASDEEESEDDVELTDEELEDLDEGEEEESDEEETDEESEDVEADEESEESEEEEESEESEEDETEEESEEEADDESEESEDENNDEKEEQDMDDAPLVVIAGNRVAAVSAYSKRISQRLVATASDETSTTAQYYTCASDEGCGAHVVSEQVLIGCPRNNCDATLTEPVLAGSDTEASLSIIDEDEEISDEEIDDASEDIDADEEELEDGDADEEEIEDEELEDEEIEDEDEATAGDDEDEIEDDSEIVEDEEIETDEVETDLMDAVEDDASIDDVDVSYSAAVAGAPAWTAYHKGVPFAVATAATIQKDHSSLFGSPRFGQVAIQAAKLGGVKKVLGELGFRGVTAKLRIPKHVETRVAALANDQIAQMASEKAEYAERMQAALATAAIGITRGFFHGKTNPVRDSLALALASAGVRNPEVMLDSAIANSFEEFLRSSLEQANEIMAKPIDVQESLSTTVMQFGYKPQSAGLTAVASSANAGEHIENRLTNFGTAVASSTVDNTQQIIANTETAVAAAGSDDFDAKMQRALGSLGRNRR